MAERALLQIPGMLLLSKVSHVNAPGFDRVFYDSHADRVVIIDNKSYAIARNVGESQASSLVTHYEKNVGKLEESLASLPSAELREKALKAIRGGRVDRFITGFVSRATGVTTGLLSKGVKFLSKAEIAIIAENRLAAASVQGLKAVAAPAMRLTGSVASKTLRILGSTAASSLLFALEPSGMGANPSKSPKDTDFEGSLRRNMKELATRGWATYDARKDTYHIPTDKLSSVEVYWAIQDLLEPVQYVYHDVIWSYSFEEEAKKAISDAIMEEWRTYHKKPSVSGVP